MAEDVLYTVYQGDCLEINRQLVDDASNDAPIDLSSALVEVGAVWSGGSWSSSTATDVVADASGWIRAEIPAAVTAGMPVGRMAARLQIRVTFAGMCPQTVTAGRIRVRRKALS